MSGTLTCGERAELLQSARREASRWNGQIDRLVVALPSASCAVPGLLAKLEELRHKRDTVATKVAALEHHAHPDAPRPAWRRAALEFQRAEDALRESWRSLMGSLQREGLRPS